MNRMLQQLFDQLHSTTIVSKLVSKPEKYKELLEDLAEWLPCIEAELAITVSSEASFTSLMQVLGNLFIGASGAAPNTRLILVRTTIFGFLHEVAYSSFVREEYGLPLESLTIRTVKLPSSVTEAIGHQVDTTEKQIGKLKALVTSLLLDPPLEDLFSFVHPCAYRIAFSSEYYGQLHLQRRPLEVLVGSRRFFPLQRQASVQWTLQSIDTSGCTKFLQISRCNLGPNTPEFLTARLLGEDWNPSPPSVLTLLAQYDSHGTIIPLD